MTRFIFWLLLLCSLASCSSVGTLYSNDTSQDLYEAVPANVVSDYSLSHETIHPTTSETTFVETPEEPQPNNETLTTTESLQEAQSAFVENTETLNSEPLRDPDLEDSESLETFIEENTENLASPTTENLNKETNVAPVLKGQNTNTAFKEAPIETEPSILEETETNNSATTQIVATQQATETQATEKPQTSAKNKTNTKDYGDILSPLELLKIAIYVALGIAVIIVISKIATHIYEKKHPEEQQDSSLLENFIFGNVQIVEPVSRKNFLEKEPVERGSLSCEIKNNQGENNDTLSL